MPGPALAHNISEYSPGEAENEVLLTITQNYILCATSVLLVYELLTTFDEEVERVWSLKWRLPKVLFMLNRYLTRALLILQFYSGGVPGTSARFCQIYGYWQVIPPRLAILGAQAVMIIRLSAIYNNSRPMLYLLLLLFFLEMVAVVTCMVMATIYTQGSSTPPPLSCGLDALSPLIQNYASGTWIAPVCFELLILIITLVKVFPPPTLPFLRKSTMATYVAPSSTKQRNPTLNLLARDSIIYFAFMFTFTLANAIIYELDFSRSYHSVLLGPTSAISCIAVSRMIINIRSLPAQEQKGAGSMDNILSSEVAFAENEDIIDRDREEEDSDGNSRRRDTASRSIKGRVTGKEREAGDYEMVGIPTSKVVEVQQA
ncbi:hypothetical protein FB45DRAFT_905185 [Roridomyces roridus]|uniref:DUF6533 domain-containing protein n=1 Tax=Roridomyces roridus TaxID=1738132 RepID=A0AAD7C5J9_9AGAR|nr:hypothetical protein FB45DRAFT_905185 [Roridomyces roridus]